MNNSCPNCGLQLDPFSTVCPRCALQNEQQRNGPPETDNNLAQPVQIGPDDHDLNLRGTCPNCGLQLFEYKAICPNCGAGVVQNSDRVWPDSPRSFGRLPLWQEYKLITRNPIVDTVLGIVAVGLSIAFFGIGVFAMPILYYVLRDSYKAFARGIGIGIIIGIVLLLGAIVSCFVTVFGGHS
jgi:hypothetical protein